MSRRPDPEEAAKLQYELEHTSPTRSRSVVPYMALLIGVAFLLLGMAWMMQERTAQSVQGLSQSASSLETIDQLVTDNQALRKEIDQLKQELQAARGQQEALAERFQTATAQATDAENRQSVLAHFALLEQALRDKEYSLAAGHVRALCSGEYDLDLGLASEEESFSPAQRLEEVIPILEKQGALEKDEVTIPQ